MEELILKFINRELSESEWETFLKLLEKPEHRRLLHQYIQDDYLLSRLYQDDNETYSYQKVFKEIDTPSEPSPKTWFTPLRLAAASLVLLLAFATGIYFLKTDFSGNQVSPVVQSTIAPGTKGALLTLEDGTEISLSRAKSYKSATAQSTGGALIYDTLQQQDTHYNYLTVKRAEQFNVVLSDGTHVWLNSDSKLKYPVAFTKGEPRRVELIYGEAYFEVSPAVNHQGASFTVKHTKQEVEVLGTAFNIKAYPEEATIYTTLVEGSVRVETDKSHINLVPNDQALLKPDTQEFIVQQIDAQQETAWRRGIFVFQRKSLKDIMTVLSRWYDVDIQFDNKEVATVLFKGTLSKEQSLNEILDAIKATQFITDYKITNNEVLIY